MVGFFNKIAKYEKEYRIIKKNKEHNNEIQASN